MARLLKVLFGSAFILLSLLILYILGGTSDGDTVTAYQIDARDPGGSWMDVTITLKPTARPFVDLYLRDRFQQKNRVRDFKVTRAGRALANWQTLPFFADLRSVWTGFSTEPVRISYQVHPQWRKGENSLRSYLGPDYGYLRAMVILYSPITVQDLLAPGNLANGSDAGRARVAFQLPEGWQVVSPLDIENLEVQTAVLRNVYFGVGPLGQEQIQVGAQTLNVGIWQGISEEERQQLRAAIPLLFETIRQETGFQPTALTCFRALTILPAEPIHGGAAGTGSLVVEDDLPTLAHEMFHWWNGETLLSTPDANWLKEGFTTYYQARLLYQTGIWSQIEYKAALRGFRNQLWSHGAAQPLNLVQASTRLVKENDPQAYPAVYFGGALLAYQLDRELQANGSSLDAIWPALMAVQQPVDTRAFLNALEALGGSEIRASSQAILYGQAALTFSDTP